MKKQKIQLIVLAIVLVALLAAYFIIPKVVKDEEEETENYIVTAIDSSTVSEISFTNDGTEISFVKENDVWYAADDKEVSISQGTVENLVSIVGNIVSVTKIDNVTDLNQYGLDNPLHEVRFVADGIEHTVIMGDYNDITGEYYLYLKGETTVYTVSSTVVTPFSTTMEAFIEVETETTEENIEETSSVESIVE